MARVDPAVALADVQPMSALVDRAQAPTWFALVLTSVFAAIAAILAAVGLYGVLSTVVSQRTAEIGVRLAFGAERRAIFRLIVGRGLMLAAIGIVIGAAAAHRRDAHDPDAARRRPRDRSGDVRRHRGLVSSWRRPRAGYLRSGRRGWTRRSR